MYHIAHNGVEDTVLGSSNFTVHGLGLANANNNIELNLEVDSNRDRRDLKVWFNEIWDNTGLGNAIPGATPKAKIDVRAIAEEEIQATGWDRSDYANT